MSLATPKFLITNAGLAVASVAQPQGPYIHITQWKVGSAYGYQPQPTDLDLNGSILASGAPIAWTPIGDNTIDILCRIGPDLGPFQFGEIGLYLDDGTLFAKAVFDQPQTKFSSLGASVGSAYTFHCLLKLQQSVAVFQITTDSGIPPSISQVDKWSDLFPPSLMSDPTIPAIKVNEPNVMGEPSLVIQYNNQWWMASRSYTQYRSKSADVTGVPTSFPVSASTVGWVEIASSLMRPLDLSSSGSTGNRSFVLRTSDGFFRSVSSVVANGSNYRLNFNPDPLLSPPAVGSQVLLYRDDGRNGMPVYYDQIVNPPSLPPATSSVMGLVRAGDGIQVPTAGVFAVNGLIQGPNAGRALGGGDNVNSVVLNSGLYSTWSGSGYPVGLPVNIDGTLWQQNNTPGGTGIITQIYFPNGASNYPPYWREFTPGIGWSTWNNFVVNGKIGMPAPPHGSWSFPWGTGLQGSGWAWSNGTGYICTINVWGGQNPFLGNDDGNRYDLTAYVDGNAVGAASDANNSWSKNGCLSIPVSAGSTIQVTSNPYNAGSGYFRVALFTHA